MNQASLSDKIRLKKARIGVIGLGYVGLPLATLLAQKGFKVTGFLRSQKKVEEFASLKTLIDTVDRRLFKKVIQQKKLVPAVLSPSTLAGQDIVIICVPTPITHDKKPDLSAMKSVASVLRRLDLSGKLVINESTVAPGTTKELFGNLTRQGFLACSPERVDPGNREKSIETISKLVGGRDKKSTRLAANLYRQIIKEVVTVSSMEVAEMAKMLENTYRAVNIALANEFALLCEKVGIDILEVIQAASTKWSYQAHFPGIGVGGHCIPVDPYYLVDLANKVKSSMTVVPAALRRNNDMAHVVFEKVKSVYKRGMTIVVYGLTYKRGVDDTRESPVIAFCELLKSASIPFTVYDPIVGKDFDSLGLTRAKRIYADIFVVGTDHPQIEKDQKDFVSSKTIVIDGRNAITAKIGSRVIGVGRAIQ